MAALPKTAEWVSEIDGVNIGDPVSGGESGAVNLRLASLAKRTEYLKSQLVAAEAGIAAVEKLVGNINVSDALLKAKNLSDIPNKAIARTNLGVAASDHTHDAAYLKIAESLGDVTDPEAARAAIEAAAKDHTHEQYTPYIIGEYKLMAHDNVPASSGFVKVNGALYDLTKYPRAFGVFGTTHGGDGLTTFALPDWRADAIRINDDGRGLDSGRKIGSEQEDALQNMVGEAGYMAAGGFGKGGGGGEDSSQNHSGVFTWGTYQPRRVLGEGGPGYNLKFDASRMARTANETRMRNRSCYMYVYIGRPGIDA